MFLGKTLNSHSAGGGGGGGGAGQPDEMLGGNLRWTSIPSRGSRNTPSRFIRRKPEISAGTDEPLARTITIGTDFHIGTRMLECLHI